MAVYVHPPLPIDVPAGPDQSVFYTTPGTYYGYEFTINNTVESSVPVNGVVPDCYWDPVTIGLENGPDALQDFYWSVRMYRATVYETPGGLIDPLDPSQGNYPDYLREDRQFEPYVVTSTEFKSDKPIIPPQVDGQYYLQSPTFGGCVLVSPTPTNMYFQTTFQNAAPLFGGIVYTPKTGGDTDGVKIAGYIDTENVKFGPNMNVPSPYDGTTYDIYIGSDGIGYMPPDTKSSNQAIPRWYQVNYNGTPGAMQPIETYITKVSQLPKESDNPTQNSFIVKEEENTYNGYYGNLAFKYVGNKWEKVTNPYVFSGYVYGSVFEESIFSYIADDVGPTENTITVVPDGEWFPLTPYDPTANPPVYPMNTVTSFLPDAREALTVTYTAKMNGNIHNGPELNGSFSWYQTVEQPTKNWGEDLRDILKTYCYYSNGIFDAYCYTTDKYTGTPYCS